MEYTYNNKFKHRFFERMIFMDYGKIIYYSSAPIFTLLLIFILYALFKNLKNLK